MSEQPNSAETSKDFTLTKNRIKLFTYSTFTLCLSQL